MKSKESLRKPFMFSSQGSEKGKMFGIAGISGAVGAGFGGASGSNSLIITFLVGAGIALLVAWGVSGLLK